ncbi:hypothetical protein [Pseudomonas shirazensis]|uniref:hypothetical protein n=1 Tax=Pseudomonas shirazensis TaxID=2745494 RepID=UPI003985EDB6
MSDINNIQGSNTAILVQDSLLACGAGMSLQSRNDVKNAFHFATLVADKLYDPQVQSKAWYDQFLKVMQDCGFVAARRSFELETASSVTVTVGAVVFRIMAAAGTAVLGGPIGDALGTLAKKAMEKLGSIEGEKRVFITDRKNKQSGMVGLGACMETPDGEVVLVMSCVNAAAPKANTDLLGVEWNITSSEYYAGSAVLSLNRTIYDRVRDHVENKLGVRSVEDILEYEI